MRIYVSGILSTLELEEIKEILDVHTIVYYGGDDNKTRIELIMTCDAIFLGKRWRDIIISTQEKSVAELCGLEIIYQSKMSDDEITEKIEKIKSAIQEVCGLTFPEYAVKSRKVNLFFARMIFVRQLRNLNISYNTITKLFNKKSHANFVNCNKKYDVEFQYNIEFRSMAKKVEETINYEL